MADSSTQPSHPRRSEPISKPAGLHLKKRLRLSHVWGPAQCPDKLSSAQRIRKSVAQASASACVEKRRELSCNKGPLAKATRQRPSGALLTSGNPGFILACLGS